MNGPLSTAADDAALDRALASWAAPAMPESLVDRIVAEAQRPDRIATMPPAPPPRMRTRRWLRPSLVAGLVSINLLAAGALAAVVHQSGMSIQDIAALPAQVIHHIVHPRAAELADAAPHHRREAAHLRPSTPTQPTTDPDAPPELAQDQPQPDPAANPLPPAARLRMLATHPVMVQRLERAATILRRQAMARANNPGAQGAGMPGRLPILAPVPPAVRQVRRIERALALANRQTVAGEGAATQSPPPVAGPDPAQALSKPLLSPAELGALRRATRQALLQQRLRQRLQQNRIASRLGPRQQPTDGD